MVNTSLLSRVRALLDRGGETKGSGDQFAAMTPASARKEKETDFFAAHPTDHDVACFYRFLLGRPAEGPDVCRSKAELATLEACLIEFLSSPEFKFNIMGPIIDGGWPGDRASEMLDVELTGWLFTRFGLRPLSSRHPRWSEMLAGFFSLKAPRDAVLYVEGVGRAQAFLVSVDAHQPYNLPRPAQELKGRDTYHLEAEELDDERVLKTTGLDPQMFLADMDGEYAQLNPGKFRFTFKTFLQSGRIAKPCIYLDFGSGFDEGELHKRTLRKIERSTWAVDFAIDAPVVRIRFDPSETFCVFSEPELTMEALRPSAVTEPLRQAADTGYASQYQTQLGIAKGARSPFYAPLRAGAVAVSDTAADIFAFYLPQFHPFPENDEWWGKGFTEWTNVSKAVPQFTNHYQPRMPGELGFYDLRLPSVMHRQIELAKTYGVSGFCFHYYWFAGKRLLETPIETFLADRTAAADFPFMLCWANENWTRRWDGDESDVLMKQEHGPEDNKNVFEDLCRYFRDPRYRKIDGKPVLVIYRPAIMPDVKAMVEQWRELAVEAGFPGIYLVATTAFGFTDPGAIDFDAICEFPPHGVVAGEITEEVSLLNPTFSGHVYQYDDVVDDCIGRLQAQEPAKTAYFPGVMASWDNEARKPGRGNVFWGATPARFAYWLKSAVEWSRKTQRASERLVFINAWNEWGEGTYLEPDRQLGYAYLSAVSSVREEEHTGAKEALESIAAKIQKAKTSDTAVCLHLFYEDLIEEFASAIKTLQGEVKVDVILSIPSTWDAAAANLAIKLIKPVRVVVSTNRGRDVWPFLQVLKVVNAMGYAYGCKMHSKKSAHLSRGEDWRRGLIKGLLGPTAARQAIQILKSSRGIGMVAPTSTIMTLDGGAVMQDNRTWVDAISSQLAITDIDGAKFVAGTMFWFRAEALADLGRLSFDEDSFGPELGAIDGTLAHAFERMFGPIVKNSGFDIETYDDAAAVTPY